MVTPSPHKRPAVARIMPPRCRGVHLGLTARARSLAGPVRVRSGGGCASAAAPGDKVPWRHAKRQPYRSADRVPDNPRPPVPRAGPADDPTAGPRTAPTVLRVRRGGWDPSDGG